MQFKLTKKEKSWIFYDVGNSAFVLMVSTILPVYFNYLAQNAGVSDVDYLAYWGYAASISTLIVAVLGPVMGTLADTRGFKKPLFLSCILVGCAGCLLMGLTTWWISFLVIFIIAKVGFNSSLVFYDSMLSDVTAPERMDAGFFFRICLGICRKLYSFRCKSCFCTWVSENGIFF